MEFKDYLLTFEIKRGIYLQWLSISQQQRSMELTSSVGCLCTVMSTADCMGWGNVLLLQEREVTERRGEEYGRELEIGVLSSVRVDHNSNTQTHTCLVRAVARYFTLK